MTQPSTVTQLIKKQALARASETALEAPQMEGLNYAELDGVTESASTCLADHGIKRGEAVAIVLPNGPHMAAAFLSVARVGIAAPLNPSLKESEFSFYLGDLGVKAVIVAEDDTTECTAAAVGLGIPVIRLIHDGRRAGAFRLIMPSAGSNRSVDEDAAAQSGSAVTPDPHAVALVLHTSGTTARPKIVPLTHANLCASAQNIMSTLELTPADVCLNVMPLFHIHGLVAALLSSVAAGARVVCTPGFVAPKFFDWLKEFDPTWYTAVPTMHQAILRRAGERERTFVRSGRLRLIRSSSASLAPSVLRETEAAFGVPVVEAYGMTEAAHQMACNPLPPHIRKPGSVGPAAGPEVAIADAEGRFLESEHVGEVVVRGHNVTNGYLGVGREVAFFGDGWFRTGDQGYLDPDGYLFLTGRLKEIINRGGETISPREIDEALLDHPVIRQAVAFSVPDTELGEEVAAAVVVEKGEAVTEAEVHSFLADRLSFARMPKRILIVDEIPKGPTGKLQRIGLAKKLGMESVRLGAATDSKEASQYAEASPETLETVTALWREILGLSSVDTGAQFLEVGGDSITAMHLVVRIRDAFDVDLPLMTFFDSATIDSQARLIDGLLREV